MELLPDEIVEYICLYIIDLDDNISCSLVCRQWYDIYEMSKNMINRKKELYNSYAIDGNIIKVKLGIIDPVISPDLMMELLSMLSPLVKITMNPGITNLYSNIIKIILDSDRFPWYLLNQDFLSLNTDDKNYNLLYPICNHKKGELILRKIFGDDITKHLIIQSFFLGQVGINI